VALMIKTVSSARWR